MFARMRKVLINFNDQVLLFRLLFKIFTFIFIGLIVFSLTGCQDKFIGMLNPKGLISYEERRLFFDTLALMLIVVLPVIVMSLTFVYHYQASHRIRDYKPNWAHSYFLEAIWWLIPCVIIVVLAVMTWKKTHELDPYRAIPGLKQPPLLVQVIALPWKWLFIYPEQNIATINYLVVPVGRQVEYWFTTDNVPMSAFFIPQLGSQIFVMSGMRTRLHLMANVPGIYEGLNTQYNGAGFSDMHFKVYATSDQNLEQWFSQVQAGGVPLTDEVYHQLLNPSIGDKPKLYAGVAPDLFNKVMMLYMHTFGTVHPRNNQLKWDRE